MTATAPAPAKKKVAKKKAAKKAAKPKTDATGTPVLFETDKIPAKVKRAATQYKTASEEKSAALAKFNGAKEALIDLMKVNNCPRVVIELAGVRKVIRLDEKDIIKIEAAAEAPEVQPPAKK